MSSVFGLVPATTAFGVVAVEAGREPTAAERSAVVDAEARVADRRHAARTVRMPRPAERRGGDGAAAPARHGPEEPDAVPGADVAALGESAIACEDVCAGSARRGSVGVVSNGFTGVASWVPVPLGRGRHVLR
jgi:hypothetical protein